MYFFTIDVMELKRMMEKLGQAKTHIELMKMISEVDTRNSGDTFSFKFFHSCAIVYIHNILGCHCF